MIIVGYEDRYRYTPDEGEEEPMKYLTVREFAERTGLADGTIRGLIGRKQIAVVRPLGTKRAIRIAEEEVNRLMGIQAKRDTK